MLTTRVPESSCPHCKNKLDAATHEYEKAPRPGDVSVCLKCAGINIYRDDLTLRAATGADLDKLSAHKETWAALKNAQKTVRRFHQFRIGLN